MNKSEPVQISQLLNDWGNGDKEALDKLMPLVYKELRGLARHYMRQERAGHTLQTTALVNEAYLRLVDQRRVDWKGRGHFFAISALLMRRILLDRAKARRVVKRGADPRKVSLDEAAAVSGGSGEQIIALDEALSELEAIDPRKSKIVELRFFGGLNIEETAEVLGISTPTVVREWSLAKAWLYRAMRKGDEPCKGNQE
jgi:RNA polymerase sigma factor (TIGR02999 family)